MNQTPNANRLHIALFGRRNSGKSSLVNALTGQDTVIVSPTPGTTTDPVTKAMEIHPLGPCLLIDTPGFDDEGELGEMRVERTLNKSGLRATSHHRQCQRWHRYRSYSPRHSGKVTCRFRRTDHHREPGSRRRCSGVSHAPGPSGTQRTAYPSASTDNPRTSGQEMSGYELYHR